MFLLKNSLQLQVSNIIQVVYRQNESVHNTVAYKAISVAQIACPFCGYQKFERPISSEITLTLLTDRSVPFTGQKIMRLHTHVNVLRNHPINYFSLYAEKRTSVSHPASSHEITLDYDELL